MNAEEYKNKQEALFTNWQKRGHHAKEKPFNKDGIVNPEVWYKRSTRILFLLKEAYHDPNPPKYDLAKKLHDNEPWSKMWQRVAVWTHGILNTTVKKIADYDEVCKWDSKDFQKELQNIAVVNIKKSNGKKESIEADLLDYANKDGDLLLEQIELINPTVIVCGYTFRFLNEICNKNPSKYDYKLGKYSPNSFCMYGNTVVLDYFHPASHMSSCLAYYGLCAIWQKALETKENYR